MELSKQKPQTTWDSTKLQRGLKSIYLSQKSDALGMSSESLTIWTPSEAQTWGKLKSN